MAIGTTDNKVSLLAFPNLEPVGLPKGIEGGDLVDVQWGGPQGSWLAVTSLSVLNVFEFQQGGVEGGLRLLQSIPAPVIDGGEVQFRAARFAPHTDKPDILVAFNATLPTRREKRRSRRAYVGKYDAVVEVDEKTAVATEKEDAQAETVKKEIQFRSVKWQLVSKREVSSKPITVFDVSADGRLLAFGSSDLSLGMLDARTLAVS